MICPGEHAEKSDSIQSHSTTGVRHSGGKEEKKSETKAKLMPIRSIKGRILKWMADTGASIDAIDIHLLSKAGRSLKLLPVTSTPTVPLSCIPIK